VGGLCDDTVFGGFDVTVVINCRALALAMGLFPREGSP